MTRWRHSFCSPATQRSQLPQNPTPETRTPSPSDRSRTPEPTALTVPAFSWPRVKGGSWGQNPGGACMTCRSLPHRPAPAIFTTTCPGPGVGTGTSWNSGARPHSIIRYARMVSTVVLRSVSAVYDNRRRTGTREGGTIVHGRVRSAGAAALGRAPVGPVPARSGVPALVGVDDLRDETVADDVGGGQAAERDVLDAVEDALHDPQPGGRAAGQVDLRDVAGDDDARVDAEPGEEPIQLLGRRDL